MFMKLLNTQKNLDVFSEDDLSEDEDFISRGKLVILPPNGESDRDTDEGSGDENELSQTIYTEIKF